MNPQGREFARYVLDPPTYYIGLSGYVGPSLGLNTARKTVQALIRRSGVDQKEVLDAMVAMLRLHRRSPTYMPWIGHACIASVVTADFRSASYCYALNPGPQRFPHIIAGSTVVLDLEIRGR